MRLGSQKLFDLIDEFKLGYISTNIFCKYILEKCGYRITDDEVTLILSRYDKDGDYRIKKNEFISEVEMREDEEEQQQ